MKSNRKTKTMFLIILGIFFAFSPIITTIFNLSNAEFSDGISLDNENLKILKVSGKIHVDDTNSSINWSVAKKDGICTGEGTYSDPYIIEDLVIDGRGFRCCILIENSEVHFQIKNCTLFNSDAGIFMNNTNSGQILNNTFSNNDIWGMLLKNCNNSIISGNTVSNNIDYGIALYYGNNNTISGNTIRNNIDIGIYLYAWWPFKGDNNVASGNIMNECGLGIYGSLETLLSNEIDKTNLVNGKPLYYYVNEGNLRSKNFTNAGQVILVNCSDSLLSNLHISYSTAAISLHYCSNGSLIKNNCSFNYEGISLRNCVDINVKENIVNNNFNGIYLRYVDDENTLYKYTTRNILKGNTASFNTRYGIYIGGGRYNNVSVNKANWNGYDYYAAGIYLENSDDNLISGNTANNNYRAGISLNSYSNNNNISGNTAFENVIEGIFISRSFNNKISGNTLNSNVHNGISLAEGDYNSILWNTAKYNKIGIILWNMVGINYNNTISGNNATNNNKYGIILDHCNNHLILGNNASYNNLVGICLEYSDYNNITGNLLIGNDECITEMYCRGNAFSDNGSCTYGQGYEIIPGYNLFLLLGFLGILTIINSKRIKKS